MATCVSRNGSSKSHGLPQEKSSFATLLDGGNAAKVARE
jgi:hypothetical protein